LAVEVVIRPATAGDARTLYKNLREADRQECEAYGPHDIAGMIERSVRRSDPCWAALADGQLGCIIGAAPLSLLGGLGSPWMLGTPVLDRHSRILMRAAPRYISVMLQAYPHLVNFVHAKNSTSVHWLRRLGFTLHAAEPYGPLGEPFHKFEMKA
jgi:hypothetical protein